MVGIVGISDGDRLIFIARLGNDRFCQNVKGVAKEDVISGFLNDMDLEMYLNCPHAEQEVLDNSE